MTAVRDARGRFVSADVAAADRVLDAACREAVRLLSAGVYRVDVVGLHGEKLLPSIARVEADHIRLAERAMFHATHAAALLLDGGPR